MDSESYRNSNHKQMKTLQKDIVQQNYWKQNKSILKTFLKRKKKKQKKKHCPPRIIKRLTAKNDRIQKTVQEELYKNEIIANLEFYAETIAL